MPSIIIKWPSPARSNTIKKPILWAGAAAFIACTLAGCNASSPPETRTAETVNRETVNSEATNRNSQPGNPATEGNRQAETTTPGRDANSSAANGEVEEKTPREHCQSNLKQVALAMMFYTQDYDDCYPRIKDSDSPGEGRNYGWADALGPYAKRQDIFQCPVEPTPAQNNPKLAGYTDYYFNSLIGGTLTNKVRAPSYTIIAGEGIPGNARYARKERESAGTPKAHSRHEGGAHYMMADGGVRWLKPEKARPSTFSVVYSGDYSHNPK